MARIMACICVMMEISKTEMVAQAAAFKKRIIPAQVDILTQKILVLMF
jgi:hypothetical protein